MTQSYIRIIANFKVKMARKTIEVSAYIGILNHGICYTYVYVSHRGGKDDGGKHNSFT